MRGTVSLLFAVSLLPVFLFGGSNDPGEAAAIAKIVALGGAVERAPAKAASAAALPENGHQASSSPADVPVVAVELSGSEKLQDEDLRYLQAFPRLTRLFLERTSTSDAGLKHLRSLKNLTRLDLAATNISDSGLGELAGLSELRVLYLSGTAITDAGLTHLKGLQNLRSLLLDGTAVTDGGLKELGNLRHLSLLELSRTKITDARLRELAHLTNLKRVFVGETEVTAAGVKRLQESLPHARIMLRSLGQSADPDFDVSVAHAAFLDKHPAILFDEAHKNLHTAGGTYKVFADLVTNDGCRVTPNRKPFSQDRLANYDLLVIANAPARRTSSKSAFTPVECDCVESWVQRGGSLLLITDHDPFGAGSQELARRFGVHLGLSVAVDPANKVGEALLFSRDKHQLGDHAILRGRDASERVDRVLTFTGQSLKGPPGSARLLIFADTAIEIARDETRTSIAGQAQAVALKFGRGRVVVLGEAAVLSAQIMGDPPEKVGMNVSGCDNRKMALNVVHWLTGLVD